MYAFCTYVSLTLVGNRFPENADSGCFVDLAVFFGNRTSVEQDLYLVIFTRGLIYNPAQNFNRCSVLRWYLVPVSRTSRLPSIWCCSDLLAF